MAKIENPKLAKFYEDGLKYINQNTKMENGQKVTSARAITPKDPTWLAWRTYFAVQLGVEPWTVREVLSGSVPSLTVPCELPENFDLSYVPPDHPVTLPVNLGRTEPTQYERAKTIAAMEAWKRNPPPPILGDPSWELLDKKGSGRKLIGWHRAGEALARFTGRNKPTQEAAE
jgi:hypothetical protein